MALTQVRAKLGDTWVVLTYNEATGRYEGTLTPSGTSYHQPSGYFLVTVEASNEAGETTSISGEQLSSLRLVVKETTAPTLTLISPTPGYLQTQTPTFVFEATDEEGGSGVDPESFSVTPSVSANGADSSLREGASAPLTEGGAPEGGGGSYTPIPGGYRFTWSPPGGWADGSHTVTASVSDYDGNTATVSGAYIVDTVPPELLLREPYLRHVVDDKTVTVSGEAWDITAPAVTVTVAGEAVTVADKKFSAAVPLEVGENHIPIKVTDGAGNQTTAEVYMIRLVTDRGQTDIDAIKALWGKPVATWTDEDRETWEAAIRRGSWDPVTLNRVGITVGWLAGELQKRGYIANVSPKTDWTTQDTPTRTPMAEYLQDVETVRSAQDLYVQEILLTMRRSTLEGWNNIEKALVEVDEIFPRYTAWTAGEITCGGV